MARYIALKLNFSSSAIKSERLRQWNKMVYPLGLLSGPAASLLKRHGSGETMVTQIWEVTVQLAGLRYMLEGNPRFL